MASGETLPTHPGADEMIRAPSRWRIGLAGLLIALAGWAAYSNSFNDAFTDDGVYSILQNPTILQGWREALHPPPGTLTVSGRPVVNLSLALNYYLDGFNVWGYHAMNVVIQVLAGLTLFGLVRRTLARPLLRGNYGVVALPLAFVIALWWTVHPLQTESVTYVIQRAESMMGLFYLLTLYCFVRGAESSGAGAWAWFVWSAMACLLGMFTKETMVTAPLLVLLYDRTFVAGSFAGAWRQRWKYYAVLACTWLPLGWVVIAVSWPGNAGLPNPALDGLSPVMKSFAYGLKQCDAITRYLCLAFWPQPLVSEYGQDVVTNPLEVAPQMAVLALLLGGTIYALLRRPALGFLGAWFFVILAPTSSVLPLAGQTMAEHHMYLSLAAVLVLAVLGLHALLGWRAYAAGVAVALGLGGLTFERNRDYRTDLSIWTDVVEKCPDNWRALQHLGLALDLAGRQRDALAPYEASLRLFPLTPGTEMNLGNVFAHLGQFDDAITHYHNEIQHHPRSAEAYYNLGNVYDVTHAPELARTAYDQALAIKPDYALAHASLASVDNDDFGEVDHAIAEYEAAVRADPNLPKAQVGLGNLYLMTSRAAEAVPHFSAVIRLNPKIGEAYLGLANAFFLTNRADEAVPQYETALRLMPDNAGTHNNFGVVLFQLRRFDDAARQFEEALRIDPNYSNASENLKKARQLAPLPPTPPKP